MFVTSFGKAYWMKVHEIPEASRTARGQHIKALLTISADEDVTTVLPLPQFSAETFVFMATARGVVKKVDTTAFRNAKTRGIIALNLDTGDRLPFEQLFNFTIHAVHEAGLFKNRVKRHGPVLIRLHDSLHHV